MHGMADRNGGLRAALRSMLGALLPSAPAAATPSEQPPMILAKTGYLFAGGDRKSTRLNSSHIQKSRMPSSA